MAGEHASARRRSGRRAHGGRTYSGRTYSGQEDAGAGGGRASWDHGQGGAQDDGEQTAGGTGSGWAEALQAGSRGDETGSRGDKAGSRRQGRDDDDPEARARQVCLRLLAFAPRTRAELAEALRRRGIADETAGEVLGRFTDAGLIDDAAFARAWVESRHYGRGLSGRALTAELRRRGVDDGQIREAVDGLGPDAEPATARRLVERKLASTAGQPPQARIRRLAGMLARKGYPPGLAFRVIREALETEGAPAGDLEADDLEAEFLEAEGAAQADVGPLAWDEPSADDPGR